MAKAEVLFKMIRKWEGGWSDHKNDKGGKTNMGITLSTWKSCGFSCFQEVLLGQISG